MPFTKLYFKNFAEGTLSLDNDTSIITAPDSTLPSDTSNGPFKITINDEILKVTDVDIEYYDEGNTGNLYASSATQTSDGANSQIWTNITNVIGDSTSTYANITLEAGSTNDHISYIVDVKGYGFNLDSEKEILGVEVTLTYSCSHGSGQPAAMIANYAQLLINGVPTGHNYGNSTIELPDGSSTTISEHIFGGPDTLWDLDLDYTDVNNSNFGFRLQIDNDGQPSRNVTIRIRRIGIKVYYSFTGTTPSGRYIYTVDRATESTTQDLHSLGDDINLFLTSDYINNVNSTLKAIDTNTYTFPVIVSANDVTSESMIISNDLIVTNAIYSNNGSTQLTDSTGYINGTNVVDISVVDLDKFPDSMTTNSYIKVNDAETSFIFSNYVNDSGLDDGSIPGQTVYWNGTIWTPTVSFKIDKVDKIFYTTDAYNLGNVTYPWDNVYVNNTIVNTEVTAKNIYTSMLCLDSTSTITLANENQDLSGKGSTIFFNYSSNGANNPLETFISGKTGQILNLIGLNNTNYPLLWNDADYGESQSFYIGSDFSLSKHKSITLLNLSVSSSPNIWLKLF